MNELTQTVDQLANEYQQATLVIARSPNKLDFLDTDPVLANPAMLADRLRARGMELPADTYRGTIELAAIGDELMPPAAKPIQWPNQDVYDYQFYKDAILPLARLRQFAYWSRYKEGSLAESKLRVAVFKSSDVFPALLRATYKIDDVAEQMPLFRENTDRVAERAARILQKR